MLLALFLLFFGHLNPLAPAGSKASVLLFIRSDCPISNRYAPLIEQMYDRYSPQKIEFHLIYVEPGLTASKMEEHRKEYGYAIPAILDEKLNYVKLAGARTTPEAAVFVNSNLVYLGRIDDRYASVSQSRPAPTRHDLEDVLQEIVDGKSLSFHQTTAVGCAIEGLPETQPTQ